MSKRTFVLNIAYAIFDTLIGACGAGIFGGLAWYTNKWWISLFALIPLSMYYNHSLIIDSDFQQIELDKLKPQKGGEDDSVEKT